MILLQRVNEWDSCPVENLLHSLGLLHLQELRCITLP